MTLLREYPSKLVRCFPALALRISLDISERAQFEEKESYRE
jgi:hypothetical protein